MADGFKREASGLVRRGIAAAASEDGASSGDAATVGPDGELLFAAAGGGSQPFIYAQLVHSADFANPACFVPVRTGSPLQPQTLVLPLSNITNVAGSVFNASDVDVKVNATLIVQNADGTIWIEQFCSPDELFAAGDQRHLDTSTNEGGAGVGLSWNAGGKRVDIVDLGAHSAFLVINAYLA